MERKMNIHAELRAKFGQRSLKIYWHGRNLNAKWQIFRIIDVSP